MEIPQNTFKRDQNEKEKQEGNKNNEQINYNTKEMKVYHSITALPLS